MNIYFYLFVTLGIIFESLGDSIFKAAAVNNNPKFFLIGFLIYILGSPCWAISLRYEQLSKAISVFTIANLLIVTLVGVFYFNENLLLINKIGIFCGILSIYFINY